MGRGIVMGKRVGKPRIDRYELCGLWRYERQIKREFDLALRKFNRANKRRR